jgi:demethylmenaquinone methyltransferase/2-methoxy-6-polyprenyl-1,4-benzoquinol methylase
MNKLSKNPLKIKTMFSSIAPRYDLLNRLLSLGRDIYWRRFAVNQLSSIKEGTFLDVATGTGDVAIEIVKQYTPNTRVTGIDFSEEMLELGRKKIIKRGYQKQIELCLGNVTSLPFEDKTFDAAIIAFGIRNLPDYKSGLLEMTRVVKEGGKIVILEFTPLERKSSLTGPNAQNRFSKWLFRLYLTKTLPIIGEIISGRKGAYRYLSDSVLDFPAPVEIKKIMEETGLKEVKYYILTLGIVAVYVGIK